MSLKTYLKNMLKVTIMMMLTMTMNIGLLHFLKHSPTPPKINKPYLKFDPVISWIRKTSFHLPPFQKPDQVLLHEQGRVHSHATDLPLLPSPDIVQLGKNVGLPVLRNGFKRWQIDQLLEGTLHRSKV